MDKKINDIEEKIGFNITALILGIASLILVYIPYLSIICAIIAIIFGIIGINKSGKGMAIIGLILSIISIFLMILFIGIYASKIIQNSIIDTEHGINNLVNNIQYYNYEEEKI